MHLDLALHLPHDAASVPAVRRVCRLMLESLDVVTDDADDVLLALTEACANVVDHAADGHDYDVRLRLDGPQLNLCITDEGGGFDLRAAVSDAATHTAETSTHGRGIALMSALVDQLSFSPVGNGTTVELVKALRVLDKSPLTSLHGSP